MLRPFLLLLALAAWGCVLDSGEDRRPEITPGRYRSIQGRNEADYDFQADGRFAFTSYEGRKATLIDSGRWEYRYDGPDKRYLIESQVTRHELGSDSAWHESQDSGSLFRINASSSREFDLDPGTEGGHPGILVMFLLFVGSDNVVFKRL